MKEHYCSRCGSPLSFISRLNKWCSGFIMTFGVLSMLLCIFIVYTSFFNPELLSKVINTFGSFLINNLAGYTYNPYLRGIALNITQSSDEEIIMKSTLDWVFYNVNYSIDAGFEDFQTPETTIERGWGDCDDFSILTCSLLRQRGMICQITCADNHCWTTVRSAFNETKIWGVDPTNGVYWEVD